MNVKHWRLGKVVWFIAIALLGSAFGDVLMHPTARIVSAAAVSCLAPHRIAIAQVLSADMQDLLGNSIPYALTDQLRACGVSAVLGMSSHEVVNGKQSRLQIESDPALIRQFDADSTLLVAEKSRTKTVPYNGLVNVIFHITLTNNATRSVIWHGDVVFFPVGYFSQRPIAGGPTIAQTIIAKLSQNGYIHGCPAHEAGQPIETVRVPRTVID